MRITQAQAQGLHDVEELTEALMAEHGLDGWTFRWNNLRTIYGLTYHGLWKRIELSKPRVLHESDNSVLDTILHEIAHALAGPDENHGHEWKRIARRIGANPQPTATEAEDGLRATTAPWVGRCPAGHTSPHRFFRKPSRRYSCSICSPQWKPEHILTYTKEV